MYFNSLTVVVDNRAREGFQATWGLSLLLQGDTNVLFDAGPRGEILLHNLELCGVRPTDIQLFFLSHNHADHAGGMRALLEAGFQGDIYLPSGISTPSEDDRRDEPEEGISSIGDGLDSIRLRADMLYEQSRLARTKSGRLLIVGCAHPGLERIWNAASTLGDVTGVVGGFHGSPPFPQLEKADILGPCHCTSNIAAFRREFPRAFLDIAAGDRIEL